MRELRARDQARELAAYVGEREGAVAEFVRGLTGRGLFCPLPVPDWLAA